MADPRAVRAVLAGMLLVPLVACGGTAPQGQKPEKPADFSLSALSAFCVDLHDAGVQLTWSAVAGAVSYVLQRDHLELATLGADAVSCTDATVQAGETHTYVLRAVNAIGLSLSAPVVVAVPFAQCGLAGPTVTAGDAHSLAIAQDGTVWAWGNGAHGKLGLGEPIFDEQVPVQVPLVPSNAIDVVAAGDSSYALLDNGTVWAWGANWDGQLGDATNTYSATPKLVSGLAGIVGLSASYDTVLTHTATGEEYGWGANGHGQLGYWHPLSENEPQKLTTPLEVSSVFAGVEHTLVVAGGQLYGAGSDEDRLLGMGRVYHRSEPAPVLMGVPLAAATPGR